MPAFIKTPADEKKWNAIKHSIAKQHGKKIEDFSDRDWATVNAAWHKSEGNLAKFEEIVKSLPMPTPPSMPKSQTMAPKAPTTSISNPAKVGVPTVKTPKAKKMPDPFGKKSLFFKSEPEEFDHVKHPTLCKLRDFMLKKHRV